MKAYKLEGDKDSEVFEFTSHGPRGDIAKLVRFDLVIDQDVYNLSFGDKDIATGEMDDRSISNNGDSEQVMSTVVSAVYRFTDTHEGAWVYAEGSTRSRTRLYRIGLTRHLDRAELDFLVFGLKDEEWEKFEKGIEYTAFLVTRI